jgi:hypothetical protein
MSKVRKSIMEQVKALQSQNMELQEKHNALCSLVAPMVDVVRKCILAVTILKDKGIIDDESIKQAHERLSNTNVSDKVSEQLQIQSEEGQLDVNAVECSLSELCGDGDTIANGEGQDTESPRA